MSQDQDTPQPVIACHECGDMVRVGRAYFTGIDGRVLPLPEARCPSCHEDAVRKFGRQ